MADIFTLFLKGLKDSVQVWQGAADVFSSFELVKRTLQITGINGVLYLGSVYLYQFISNSSFFGTVEAQDTGTLPGLLIACAKIFGMLIYNVWIFMIYIMAMTLTTFWVQDIFDGLLQIKLLRYLRVNRLSDSGSSIPNMGGSGDQFRENSYPTQIKNPSKLLRKMHGLDGKTSAKEKSIDLIQRTLIISIYLILSSLITLFTKYVIAVPYLSSVVEIFLYSTLHAYYCYEYKATVMEVDFLSSIAYFEAQWAYFAGFGFLFTIGLYLFKSVGSSLFFLFFPLMVVISLDEGGQGLLMFRDDRVTNSCTLPVLTMAYHPHKWILRKLNAYMLRQSD